MVITGSGMVRSNTTMPAALHSTLSLFPLREPLQATTPPGAVDSILSLPPLSPWSADALDIMAIGIRNIVANSIIAAMILLMQALYRVRHSVALFQVATEVRRGYVFPCMGAALGQRNHVVNGGCPPIWNAQVLINLLLANITNPAVSLKHIERNNTIALSI